MKYLLLLSIFFFTLSADILDFYKSTLENLQYNKSYSFYKQSNILKQNAVSYGKYANFSIDANYANTKAKALNNSFNTTDIIFNDTVDLFDKGSYKIDELRLELNAKKVTLNIKKESIFVSLVEMISFYTQTNKKLKLHKSLLNEQEKIYDKLKILKLSGAVSNLDLLRFKNILIQLKTKIVGEKNDVEKMLQQLHLYSPNQDIPNIEDTKFIYSKSEFLSNNLQKTLNEVNAKQLIAQAKSVSKNYLPDVIARVTYQKINDPTSYGNNYSFNIGIHMPLDSFDFKQAEALRLNALSVKSENIEYKIKRENEYMQRYHEYISAKKQLEILKVDLVDNNKSEQNIKGAFLKQFVDFNTYLQVLTQTLGIKEQIIQMYYQKNSQALILNSISSGVIYE